MELPIYLYFLFISFLTGLSVYFKRPSPLYLKLLPIYLLVNLVAESVGLWMAKRYAANAAIYNISIIISFWLLLFILKEIVSEAIVKKIILFISLLFVALSLTNAFFIQKIHTWNSITYAMGSLLVVAGSIYYFFELFKKPKSIKLMQEPAFWIVCGLLFFHCCSFPLLGLNNFLIGNAPLILLRNLVSILTLLNILLYVLFTVAFLSRFFYRKSKK